MKKFLSILTLCMMVMAAWLHPTSMIHGEEQVDTTSGASEKEYLDPSEMKDQYDIVVVGAGGGGMAAALSAKEAGADVVVLEKMPIVGGNTNKSSAGMNAAETKFQKEQGVEDSKDAFYEESLEGGHGTNNPELLRFLADNASAAIDWLDSMGITLSNVTTTGGMSQPRAHRPADGSAVGGYLVDGLYGNITENDIPLFVNSNVTEVTFEEDQVTGVKVEVNGEEKTIAAKAVIIATGGFGANLEKVQALKPELQGFVTTNHEGAQGDGITMAEQLDAATVDMEQIQIHPTVEQKTSYLITEAVRGEGAILVNQAGHRFFNEMETRDKVSQAELEQEGQYAYIIGDSALKERVKAIATYEEKGLVVNGETIEELANNLEMDPAALQATLDTWNKTVQEKDEDEFGRTTAMDHDLSKAPYFAIKVAPGIHHTMGGLVINTDAQVLNTEEEPIQGLYGAGEVTGGIHGENRIGGNAVADIIVFGRQAGTKAAEFVK